jgi:hypothetical protein
MPREAATDRIALRHFFVTPGVAAAHALSGLAIFAGAASVLKTTPLYLLGSIVPNPAVAASILIATAALAIIPYLTGETRRLWFIDSPATVFVANAFCVGCTSDHGWTLP